MSIYGTLKSGTALNLCLSVYYFHQIHDFQRLLKTDYLMKGKGVLILPGEKVRE